MEILLLDKNRSFLLPEAVKIARLPNFPLLVFSAMITSKKGTNFSGKKSEWSI